MVYRLSERKQLLWHWVGFGHRTNWSVLCLNKYTCTASKMEFVNLHSTPEDHEILLNKCTGFGNINLLQVNRVHKGHGLQHGSPRMSLTLEIWIITQYTDNVQFTKLHFYQIFRFLTVSEKQKNWAHSSCTFLRKLKLIKYTG